MGRARNTTAAAVAPLSAMRGSALRMDRVAADISMSAEARLLASYERKHSGVALTGNSREDDRRRYEKGGYLQPDEIRSLKRLHDICGNVLAHIEAGHEEASPAAVRSLQQTMEAARETFIISSYGMASEWMKRERTIAGYIGSWEGDRPSQLDNGYQAVRMGLTDAFDKLDIAEPGHPLTFARSQVLNHIGEATEKESSHAGMLFKSRAHDSWVKVRRAVAQVRAERGADAQLDPAEIQRLSGVEDGHFQNMFPLASARSAMPLDAQVRFLDRETQTTYERSRLDLLMGLSAGSTEDEYLTQERTRRVADAVEELPTFDRMLLEAQYGLHGGEPVEQRFLYMGVYRDAKGNAFTSEDVVAKAFDANNDAPAQKASQKVLNRRFSDGELRWDPLSHDTRVLSMALAAERNVDRFHSATGVPLTSGIVQDRVTRAALSLRNSPHLQGEQVRYRGPFELENSESARELMRAALVAVGDADQASADRIKAGRGSEDGSHKRGPLPQLGIKRGWVNPDDGRVDWLRVQRDVEATGRGRAAAQRVTTGDSDSFAEVLSAPRPSNSRRSLRTSAKPSPAESSDSGIETVEELAALMREPGL